MKTSRFALLAAAGLGTLALLAVTSASGTEAIAKQEKLECTACHDKPGSKLLTDQGKYYETMRTLAGFEELKSTFGACTKCHVRKPGSKKLTAEGKKFQDLVADMEGLGIWMQQHHPTPPPAEPKGNGGH